MLLSYSYIDLVILKDWQKAALFCKRTTVILLLHVRITFIVVTSNDTKSFNDIKLH